MKRAILAIALALCAPLAFAQSGTRAQGVGGVITKVDPATEKVTIRHEPVPTLNWPAMTMAFKARDKKMLEKLKPGAKIDFDFEQQGKDYVITNVR